MPPPGAPRRCAAPGRRRPQIARMRSLRGRSFEDGTRNANYPTGGRMTTRRHSAKQYAHGE